MHGVSRESWRNRSAEELARIAKKKEKYAKLSATLFGLRRLRLKTEDSLELTGAMCRVNPDCYTAWNYRRQILHALSGAAEGTAAPDAWPMPAASVATELQLTQEALAKQPKSYCAWHHRRWALSRAEPGGALRATLAGELELCARLLDLDERNFHCWTYRRWVAGRAGVTPEEDLAFCRQRLDVNFSNYSAFHQRSKVLPRLAAFAADPLPVLRAELDLVADITVTEPDDQSAWWYYQFLLERLRLCGADGSCGAAQVAEVLAAEEGRLRDLIAMEASTKWGRVLLARVLTLQGAAAPPGGPALQEAAAVYAWLAENDADRAAFWRARREALPR